MKRSALLFATLLLCSIASYSDAPKRPRILGIASVRILTRDLADSKEFFSKVLREDKPCIWCGQESKNTFSVNYIQYVQLAVVPPTVPSDLIDEITFETDDVPGLWKYLAAQGIPPTSYFSILDPEGHRIGFVQLPPNLHKSETDANKMRLIHAGIIVKDRAEEDRFYKDILGFHVYWHGGMKEGEDHWVDMQVPDGTDWIEYMLNVPADASKHTLGVMNHIAIGVPDVAQSAFELKKNAVPLKEDPKIGRDGKWQLNLYDPDDTRIEFMEFTPVRKPCCSEFTGPHPGPQPQSKAPAKP
ncbi:MAG TPA: VOC family protein [Candidatus Acidoferrum sp.]|nr:VOC family protein [Candidatus Acidoferrum sp.]